MKYLFSLLMASLISASAYADIAVYKPIYLYGKIPVQVVLELIMGCITFPVMLLFFLKKKKQSEKQERRIKIFNSVILFVYVALVLLIASEYMENRKVFSLFYATFLFVFICFGIPTLKLMPKHILSRIPKQYLKIKICVRCVCFVSVVMLVFIVSRLLCVELWKLCDDFHYLSRSI